MSRPRFAIPSRPPVRRKLTRTSIRELHMLHAQHLDALATGRVDDRIMWDWAAGALTWSKVAELIGQGEPQMNELMAVVERVVSRYKTDGTVKLTPEEYDQVRQGSMVMDLLAETTDLISAGRAAQWSEDVARAVFQLPDPGAH